VSRYRRWKELLELLAAEGQLQVMHAARALAVSPATVRRDFDELAWQQKLTRIRGGAVARSVLAMPRQIARLNGGATTTSGPHLPGNASEDHDEPRQGRLACLVRSHRKGAGLTQRQLADLAGISLGTLEDLEQGRTVRPRREALARLAGVLQLRLGELEYPASTAGQPAGGGLSGRGLRVEVLGPLAVWRDGLPVIVGPVRLRAVLGLLVMYTETGLRQAVILDALWGDDPPSTSVAMIHAQISRIRRLLGPGPSPGGGSRLLWDGCCYRLSLDGIELDLAEFAGLAGRARHAVAAGDTTAGCALYEQALGLWRGHPLEGIGPLYGHPAITELDRRRGDVVMEYADAAASAGQPDRVVTHLEALTVREPLDERAHARLMETLAATGHQGAAFQVYQDLAARLDRELGVMPGTELSATLLRVLRRQVPAGAAAHGGVVTAVATCPGCPYSVPRTP
jgi:DNA-binding SARP family transcriptional activator/DNA-binding XRE family transcriptional regulator